MFGGPLSAYHRANPTGRLGQKLGSWRRRRPAAAPSFYTFDGNEALVDLDFDNGNFKVGDNIYTSLADFTAAGWMPKAAWLAAPDAGYLDITALGIASPFVMRVEGATGPVIPDGTVVVEYLAAVDDGPDGSTIDEITYIGWTNANKVQAQARHGNNTTLDMISSGTIGTNTDLIVAARFKTNSGAMSYNGVDPATDVSGAMATGLNRLMVGGRVQDDTRQWSGPTGRVTLLDLDLGDGALQAMSRDQSVPYSVAYGGYIDPLAVSDGTYTYFGANHKFGQFTFKVRNDTKQVVSYKKLNSTYNQVDDHNSSAVLITPGGALLYMYTGHGLSPAIRFRRSATLDPADVGSEQTIDTSAIGDAAYCQLSVHGPTGHIYARFRCSDYSWCYSVSTDDGVTFSAPKVLVTHATTKCYMYSEFLDDTSDTMLLVVNENATSGTAALRIGKWDVVTGDVSNSSGALFNRISETDVTVGANMTDFDALSQVSERSSSGQGFGNGALAFPYQLTDTTVDPNTVDYYYASYKGSGDVADPANWNKTFVVAGGEATGTDGRWTGTLCIAREPTTYPRLYLSRHVGSNWQIEQWDCTNADGTAGWTLTDVKDIEPDAANNVAFRPKSPLNCDDSLPLFWLIGTHNDFDDFDHQIQWEAAS